MSLKNDVEELARTAKVSSRPADERVEYLRATIAMLRELRADSEERGRALYDLVVELNLKADPAIDDLAAHIAPAQMFLFPIADLLAGTESGMYAGALDGFDAATLAELERRLNAR